MDRCTVTLAETGDLKPLLLPALRSQGVTDAVAASGKTHPFPPISRAWHDIERALERFFEAEPLVDHAEGMTAGIDSTLDAYRDFLYRSAEYVEAVEKQMRELFDDKKAFKATGWMDRLLSEECNALKHNGMRLGWVSAANQFMRVYGYQIRHHVGEAETEAMQFHKKSPAYSFGFRIRKMLVALYLVSEEAGRKVIASFGPAMITEQSHVSPTLVKATKVGVIVFPGEKSLAAPILQINEAGDLIVNSANGKTLPLGYPFSIKSVHAGDGFTTTFGIANV